MKFKNYLNEARKNPEINKKMNIVDNLEPFKDNKNYYIHFSDLNKIGINPKTEWLNPAGIYAYPLKEIWKFFKYDKIPFAGNKKYCILLSVNNQMLIDVSEYTEQNLKKDIQKLNNFVKNKTISLPDYYIEVYEEIKRDIKSKRSPISKIWELTRELANLSSDGDSIWKWNKIFRLLGYIGITDRTGTGTIHTSEPTQAIFFSKENIKVVDVFNNIRPIVRKEMYQL